MIYRGAERVKEREQNKKSTAILALGGQKKNEARVYDGRREQDFAGALNDGQINITARVEG